MLDDKPQSALFDIRLNYKNWSIIKVEIYSKEATRAGLADKFAEGINEDFKQSILRHVEKVKALAERNHNIDVSLVRSSSSVGYAEIFEDEDQELFVIEQ